MKESMNHLHERIKNTIHLIIEKVNMVSKIKEYLVVPLL